MPAATKSIDATVMRRLKRLEQLIDDDYERSPAEFERKTGIKMSQVNQWFTGYRALRDKALRRLEDKTGKPEGWFDAGEGADDLMLLQYEAAGAMGNGGLILEESPPGVIKSWKVDPEWIRLNVQHHTGVANLCIVTGFGPSMRPRYNPGDPLLIDRGVQSVESGGDGVYFFRVGNHGFIKQLQRIPTAAGLVVRAKSFNPDYDPFDITHDMDFHVLGKILTVWKSEQM